MADLSAIRAAAIRWAAASVGWLVTAALTWSVILGLEVVHVGEAATVAPVWGRIAYLVEQSLRLSLAASVPLAGLHLARLALARTGRLYKPLMALVFFGVISLPAHDQAEFLTSGGGISHWRWVQELAVVLFLVLVAAHYALWRWHVRGLTAPSPERAERSGLAAFVAGYAWSLGGTIALMALVYVLSFELKAYAYFARFLLIPTWLIAATLVYRTCGGPLRRGWAAAGLSLVLLGLGQLPRAVGDGAMADARTDHLRIGKIAALNDVLTRPEARAFTSFDLSDAKTYDCARFADTPEPPPLSLAEEQRNNVLLISVDALRRDALDWLEEGRPVMPQVRSFAARSRDFERAVTTYPATLLAMGGALTGLQAGQLFFAPRVPDNIFKLTQARFANQFAALPESSWFKRENVDELLLQGIDHDHFPDANAQTAWFIRRLKKARRQGGGLLGWIHYYEPHQGYVTHEAFDFGDAPRQRYMSELAYVDHHLGRLLRFLARNHWYEDTLVILFSDHGQALGERDYYGHHVYLDGWMTDIPLLVRAPGFAPDKLRRQVDVTDVAATVLHFAGLPSPAGSGGVSLLATPPDGRRRLSFAEAFPVRGQELFRMANEPVKSLEALKRRMDRMSTESRSYVPKVSVVSSTHRLIVDRITGHEELHDRTAKTAERRDLGAPAERVRQSLREELHRWSALQAAEIYCRVTQAQWERKGPRTARHGDDGRP